MKKIIFGIALYFIAGTVASKILSFHQESFIYAISLKSETEAGVYIMMWPISVTVDVLLTVLPYELGRLI